MESDPDKHKGNLTKEEKKHLLDEKLRRLIGSVHRGIWDAYKIGAIGEEKYAIIRDEFNRCYRYVIEELKSSKEFEDVPSADDLWKVIMDTIDISWDTSWLGKENQL